VVVTTDEGRRRIVGDLTQAIGTLDLTLACLAEAFDLLATGTADRMETELFRPAQKALGRAKRTQAAFASAHGLEIEQPSPASAGPPSQGAKALIERSIDAAGEADRTLAELQDSMLPIEVGDPDLRAGLSDVRALVGALPAPARELLRGLGR
jgi:hypothetical protein